MQSVLDLPNLSSWYAQPKLPWDQFGKCKVGYEKAMYILVMCKYIYFKIVFLLLEPLNQHICSR